MLSKTSLFKLATASRAPVRSAVVKSAPRMGVCNGKRALSVSTKRSSVTESKKTEGKKEQKQQWSGSYWDKGADFNVHRQIHGGRFASVPFGTIFATLLGITGATTLYASTLDEGMVDYEAVRADIAAILEAPGYDAGSYGPVLVRLAWHSSGSYGKETRDGGSDGATMRFHPECAYGANAGLDVARDLLEPIYRKYVGLSYADLYVLAGVEAIAQMDGPKIKFHPGRSDAHSGKACAPDGRLPDADKGADHVRAIFNRMGFNDREIVALLGAHAVGQCHTNRSGYDGPWTKSPTMFSNSYFTELLDRRWSLKNWNGPAQFEDESGKLMMLPADMALLEDPKFRKYVKMYAEDEELFFNDFAAAFQKLTELGCDNLQRGSWVSRFFGW